MWLQWIAIKVRFLVDDAGLKLEENEKIVVTVKLEEGPNPLVRFNATCFSKYYSPIFKSQKSEKVRLCTWIPIGIPPEKPIGTANHGVPIHQLRSYMFPESYCKLFFYRESKKSIEVSSFRSRDW